MAFPYDTGFSDEDQATRKMIAQLVNAPLPEHFLRELDSQGHPEPRALEAVIPVGATGGSERSDSKLIHEAHQEMKEDIQECRTGFNERELFQVPKGYHGAAYWEKVGESEALRDSFRSRFQNITRIMDCVTCDKCRVWGKLQILGLGTAIRILLSSDEMLSGPEGVLSRQEVITLAVHSTSCPHRWLLPARLLNLSWKASSIGSLALWWAECWEQRFCSCASLASSRLET